jgi:transcriptional regulator with XRE-family HTH domain
MNSDDERLGQLLKAIRRSQSVTQAGVALVANVPRGDVIRIERGRAGEVPLSRVRRVFEAAGGRARLNVWFNGATADRLLDSRHAALVARALRVFLARGWQATVEVSFAEFGERGSIDLLAGHQSSGVAVVGEIKTVFGSLEETNRVLDMKVRLAKKIVKRAFGWWPAAEVGRLLIVPDEMTVRRTIDRHSATMNALYPARGREVRAWLRRPTGGFGGIWFLSEVRAG